MDQVTKYIPAFFVNELRLWQDDTVLAMKRHLDFRSPNIRFTYVS
jgi:sulfur-oxidizing protein SoxY